jgi:hypothetical protein
MGVRVAFLSQAAEADAADTAPAPPLLVPDAAVQEEGGATHVFVLQGERVARRAVEVGAEQGGFRPVLEGLRSGERVVLSPPADLADGATVRAEQTGR